jgi:hypothetical protein
MPHLTPHRLCRLRTCYSRGRPSTRSRLQPERHPSKMSISSVAIATNAATVVGTILRGGTSPAMGFANRDPGHPIDCGFVTGPPVPLPGGGLFC